MIYIKNYILPKENDDGNIEYKREILNLNKIKNKYLIQMIYRLNEGNGIAYYYIGVNDDGTFYKWDEKTKKESLKNLIEIISEINAKIKYILEFNSGYKIKIYSDEFNNDFIF